MILDVYGCAMKKISFFVCCLVFPLLFPFAVADDSPQRGAVDCNTEAMMGIGCKFNIYDMLGIQQKTTNKTDRTSVSMFVQDLVLAATFFIGTVVTLAFIISGLLFVFSAVDSKQRQRAISGMKNAAIGFVLVLSAYAIIRLVQYIAAG